MTRHKMVKISKVGPPDFFPNERPLEFQFRGDTILVEVENSMRGLFWRMTVNGVKGNVTSYYQGVYTHAGYCLTTNYWDGVFVEFIPFKVDYATVKEGK